MTRNVADAILKIRPRAATLYGARTCLQAIDLLTAAGDSTIGKQRQHNMDKGASHLCTLHGRGRGGGFRTRLASCHSCADRNRGASLPWTEKLATAGPPLFLDTRSAHSLNYSVVKEPSKQTDAGCLQREVSMHHGQAPLLPRCPSGRAEGRSPSAGSLRVSLKSSF